ncbi:hypothetical protein PACTADRAFT_50839 [Pachysolen tannophilus NRRL Y-2460]|uniref:Actin cytoskeleton-regulatory complex protein PAN1 n=1 Tax=Pachysolen tannophilus NRRL Y-2460 TaxID=669874 RepID=A0A1E4TTK4_PACTA|nr:hypothetical protein PACTADRAFT_50839 [Pachysolen tannophilus NRRL Y-2460]
MIQPNLRQSLTQEEQKIYGQLFKSLDPEGLGIVTGEAARSTFEKSGLSPAVLGEIWQVADTENNGFLSQFGFSVAMRLIGQVQHTGASPSFELAQNAGPLPKFQSLPSISQLNVGSRVPSIQAAPSLGASPPQPNLPVNAVLPPLTSQDVIKFGQLYDRTANNGVLDGSQAKSIFIKAKLPTSVLGQIWNLVDEQNAGQLTRPEFIVAMYLIQNTLNGSIKNLPQSIPTGIWNIARGASSNSSPQITTRAPSLSQQTGRSTIIPTNQLQARTPSQSSVQSVTSSSVINDWAVSPQLKQEFDKIFDNLDTNHKGELGPTEVAQYLMTSGLPQDMLAVIWDLADIHNTGEFTKKEFSIALYLVRKKLQGASLPDVVPESLIASVGMSLDVNQSYQQQPQAPQYNPKSSIDELADIFSTPSPVTSAPAPPAPKSRLTSTASSTSNHTTIVNPALTSSVTGSRAAFVPSSNFGQKMVLQQQQNDANSKEPPSLLQESEDSGDEEGPIPAVPAKENHQPTIPSREQKPQFSGSGSAQGSNYEVFRSFSEQANNTSAGSSGSGSSKTFSNQQSLPQQAPNVSDRPPPAVGNKDLLADADPEVSGKLSQATTDIANISNQINSLTSQTTQLNDKRERASNELKRILALKNDIESKLTKLRALYDQEVKQVQEVETVLIKSKNETEELRKEASLVEANYHATQAKLQNLQMQFEESQKENQSLKEKLGLANAENIELTNQYENLVKQSKQQESLLSVSQQQVNVIETKNSELRKQLDAKNKEIDALENNRSENDARLMALKAEGPMLEAALSAALATFNATKSAISNSKKDIEFHEQQNDQYRKQLESHSASDTTNSRNVEEEPVDIAKEVSTGKSENFFGGLKEAKEAIDTAEEAQSQGEKESTATSGQQANVMRSPTNTTVAASEKETATTETPATSSQLDEEEQDPSANQQYPNINWQSIRPESATSSVQNNAPLSVRGEDNISEKDSSSASSIANEEESPAALGTAQQLEQTSNDFVDETVADVSAPTLTTTVPEEGKEIDSIVQNVSSSGESYEFVNPHDVDESGNAAAAPGAVGSSAARTSSDELSKDSAKPSLTENKDDAKDVKKEGEEYSGVVMPGGLPGEFGNSEGESVKKSSDDIVEGTSTTSSKSRVTSKKDDEEFPPIKELDYPESDSSDDDDQEFHDSKLPDVQKVSGQSQVAVDQVNSATFAPQTSRHSQEIVADDFFNNKDFEDLQPAVQTQDDGFQDKFEGLQEAQIENEDFKFSPEAEPPATTAFDNQFFGSSTSDANALQSPGAFDAFNELEPAVNEENNDEWEQLFAGFGNAPRDGKLPQQSQQSQEPQAAQAPPHSQSRTASHSKIVTGAANAHDLAIQELVGMGFTEDAALNALKQENWNLENATNYLLDNA